MSKCLTFTIIIARDNHLAVHTPLLLILHFYDLLLNSC